MDKTLYVDVDDVILDWIGDFGEHMGYGRDYTPQQWGYPEKGIPYSAVEGYIQQGPSHTPIIDTINWLNDAQNKKGWKVVLITAHPTNKMKERIDNLNKWGLWYDHIVMTQFYNKDGTTSSISKAQYIKDVYGSKNEVRILIDDRLKSVNEFVAMGLGFGASVVREYNDKDLEALQESHLRKRVVLGYAPFDRMLQVKHMLEAASALMDHLDTGIAPTTTEQLSKRDYDEA
jgi:hypothetical protein